MGHTTVDTTLNVYTQGLDAVRVATDRVGTEWVRMVQKPERRPTLIHWKDRLLWTRTSQPPVNSVTQVFGSRVLRPGSSDENAPMLGVRQRIVQRLCSPMTRPMRHP